MNTSTPRPYRPARRPAKGRVFIFTGEARECNECFRTNGHSAHCDKTK
jgi:hypothetical protein